jgi:hypothetical protein
MIIFYEIEQPDPAGMGFCICLALYCCVYLENIGFVYPAMSMIVIGPSLLY